MAGIEQWHNDCPAVHTPGQLDTICKLPRGHEGMHRSDLRNGQRLRWEEVERDASANTPPDEAKCTNCGGDGNGATNKTRGLLNYIMCAVCGGTGKAPIGPPPIDPATKRFFDSVWPESDAR